MATLNGQRLTPKQLAAMEKKWQAADQKFWREEKKKKIAREQKHLAKLKKLPKTALRDRLIKNHTAEIQRLKTQKL